MTTITTRWQEAFAPDYPSVSPRFTPSAANDDRAPTHAPGERSERKKLRVRDVISPDFVSVPPDTSIREIARLLDKERGNSIPVVDRTGRLVGVVSEGDLIRRPEIGTEPRRAWWHAIFLNAAAVSHEYVRSHGKKARDVMTLHPITASGDEPLHAVAKRMERTGLKRLPVVRDNRLVGMVSRSDLVRELAGHSEEGRVPMRADDATIREDVMVRMRALPWNLRIRLANVTVENGIAHLYGWVTSDVERRALEVVAENSPGVLEVKDHLQSARLFM